MGISIKDVSKSFGTYSAVSNVNLEVPTGDFVALLGPSGSGKTTLLRLIAGLENIDSGKVLFNSVDYTHKTVKERKVGFVFQNYALFQHMNIFENVAFGLKVRARKSRLSKTEIKEKVFELLKLVKLEQFADRYPSQLSGGQRQRIALARSLAVEPEVLLLDEPFGALDAKVRLELRRWLREIHQKLNITTIFVTHDQEEALEMADTVVVMNNGRIEQIGSPEDVYHQPLNAFVYSFLGRVNEFSGDALLKINNQIEVTEETVGYIRPHEIMLNKWMKTGNVPAEVRHVHTVGSIVRIELRGIFSEDFFEVEMNANKYLEIGPFQKGETLYAEFKNLAVFGNNKDHLQLENNKLRAIY